MATKSFIKTIGSKGLLSDYNTAGKKLQTELIAGDRVTINGNTISADNQIFYETPGRGQLDDQPLRKKSKWAPDFRPLPQKQTSPKVLNIMQTRVGGNEK